jgi:hypothetical protein
MCENMSRFLSALNENQAKRNMGNGDRKSHLLDVADYLVILILPHLSQGHAVC